MTHKSFYHAAVDEIAQGNIDQALWIKVQADTPNASDDAKQALYIQIRAREIEREQKGPLIVRLVPGVGLARVAWMVGVPGATYLVSQLMLGGDSTSAFGAAVIAFFVLGFILSARDRSES